jgi:ATP-dependent helicase HrpA
MEELAAIYEQQMAAQNVRSLADFRRARLGIDAEQILSAAERDKYLALPDSVEIRGREIPIRYDVEESDGAVRPVARLTLPEKVARSLAEEELPTFDRPFRFMVQRGQRGAARADTLDALREELDRPFTDEEIAQLERAADRKRDERKQQRQERTTREVAREMRRSRSGGESEERRKGPRTPYKKSSRGPKPAHKRKGRGRKSR